MESQALLIYSKKDVDKNKKFIDICGQFFKTRNIQMKLIIIEKNSIPTECENVILAINRSRNAKISRELLDKGVPVYNSPKVTDICNDKWKTYMWARERNIPLVKTALTLEELEEEFPVVVKSRNGHGGSEVFLVHDYEQYTDAINKVQGGIENIIVQPFVNTGGRDIRTYVIGQNIVVSMERKSEDDFKSNFSLGGSARQVVLKEEEKQLVEKIIKELDPHYVGVDLMYDGTRLVLNEIEDAVGARMVYMNTNIDIINEFLEYIMTQ